MPLSEDEQRILRDIERNFYESDPAFAEAVSKVTPYKHARRNAKLAVVGFLASLVTLVLTFQTLVLGLVAFLGMVASAFLFVQNFRRFGAATDAPAGDRAQRVNDSLSETRRKLRRRFKTD